MRNKLWSFAAVCSAFVLLLGCSDDKKVGAEMKRTSSLYADLKEIYSVYADSLAATEDSAKIDTLGSNLDDRVRRIYLNYPPELDYHISESQNDTLWRYVARITSLRNRMRKVSQPDTLVQDSTGVLPEEIKRTSGEKP